MFIYKNDAEGFLDALDNGRLTKEISQKFASLSGRPNAREVTAWNNSLPRMGSVLRMAKVPMDCGVLIEYKINASGNRVDFIISGHDDEGNKNMIIIELKQWSVVEETYIDDVFKVTATPEGSLKVSTFTGGAIREVVHPSYQAMSYKLYLQDMNETVSSGSVNLESCSYLHNYYEKEPEPLKALHFREILEDTPIFLSEDAAKLSQFIKKYVGRGDGVEILYEVENGHIRPSKNLVKHVNAVFQNNNVYTLIDEQKVAYASIIKHALQPKGKTTIIVNGGPGTGKSIVAVLSLVELLNNGKNVRFITPNQAFREAIVDSITNGSYRNQRISVLFSGSSKYYDAKPDTFDALIVDEAHRLKSPGTYMYQGIHGQVWDMVNSAHVSVFFVDDNQMIRKNDEGSVKKIKEVAKELGSTCIEVELDTQFRCAGAGAYIDWLDNVLKIENKKYDVTWNNTYEFQIFDDPNELYEKIRKLNKEGASARMLAGFAWDWYDSSKPRAGLTPDDVSMDEFNFHHSWNSRKNSFKWAINDEMQDQIGCIHTSQGLEFDYVGVIIGRDLKYDPFTDTLRGDYDEYKDSAGKKGLRNSPMELTKYIKNIYKVLLTRGSKGCFVFCRDKEMKDYFKKCYSVCKINNN